MSYLALYENDLADITDIADSEDLENVRSAARDLRYGEYDIDEVVRVILLLCSVIESLYDELGEEL